MKTQKEVAEQIIRQGDCNAISCNGDRCPLHHGLIDCGDFGTVKEAAKAWIDDQEEMEARLAMESAFTEDMLYRLTNPPVVVNADGSWGYIGPPDFMRQRHNNKNIVLESKDALKDRVEEGLAKHSLRPDGSAPRVIAKVDCSPTSPSFGRHGDSLTVYESEDMIKKRIEEGLAKDVSFASEMKQRMVQPPLIDNEKQGVIMNTTTFNRILEERLEQVGSVLGRKAAEYSQNDDRLHNFRLAATVNSQTLPEALWGMSTKHLVSIIDMVNTVKPPTKPMADEKIGDMINYLILLEAVWEEQRGWASNGE